jgi:hypothetical protein
VMGASFDGRSFAEEGGQPQTSPAGGHTHANFGVDFGTAAPIGREALPQTSNAPQKVDCF